MLSDSVTAGRQLKLLIGLKYLICICMIITPMKLQRKVVVCRRFARQLPSTMLVMLFVRVLYLDFRIIVFNLVNNSKAVVSVLLVLCLLYLLIGQSINIFLFLICKCVNTFLILCDGPCLPAGFNCILILFDANCKQCIIIFYQKLKQNRDTISQQAVETAVNMFMFIAC